MYVSQVMLIAMLMLLIWDGIGNNDEEARGWNSIRNGFFLT